MSIKRIIQMTTQEDGSIFYEFCLEGYQTFLYMPANEIQSNLINYGFTGPTLAVFCDKKVDRQEAQAMAAETGLLEVARRNGVGIVFVNPKGADWSEEAPGAYEALTGALGIAQSNFRDGLAIMKDDAVPDVVEYKILGSCVRMYAYGIGTGADYLAKYYLRHVEGSTVLGDLGMADLSMVCCTLVKGNVLPTPEKNDLHVVSVGNSEAYNEILRGACDHVTVEDTVDFARDFYAVVGNYRRWVGKILPAYNYAAEGIVDKAASVMLPVSPDNIRFQRRFMSPKEHKVGYVAFYDQNLDVKNGKVPLVLVFHGGGDSAYATASLAEWPEIGQREGFLTVAVEMHLNVTAAEVCALIDHLCKEYSIDESRIYATGFSMGGIKSWDLFEQFPERFAAIMPMNAVDHVGNNCQGGKTEKVNRDTLVPLFYIGGASSFLVEVPAHHERAIERVGYAMAVNGCKTAYDVKHADKDNWADPFMGIPGDRVEVLHDEMYPQSEYHVHYYDSQDGNCYTVFMAVTNHGHEIRTFTNNFAWNFAKQFRRTEKGIEIVK